MANVIPDKDGKYRRMILGSPADEEYKHSFCLRLAEAYLSREGITLENGILDTAAMRFGSTELPRFLPNTGGYVGTDAGGVQMLLNFRSGAKRFRTLSLNDIKTGNFNPEWISDRIVMIGMTTSSVSDFIDTSAIVPSLIHDGQVYGVEFNAHRVEIHFSLISYINVGAPSPFGVWLFYRNLHPTPQTPFLVKPSNF